MNKRALIKIAISVINHISPDHFVIGAKGNQIKFSQMKVVSANINFQEQVLELLVEHPSLFEPYYVLTNVRLEEPKKKSI